MDPSLSILLPVHNAPHGLEERVDRLLDVLPELTGRFDVVIIDDGSTDDTTEIARGLAVRYPQVNLVRHPWRLGLTASIQTGLDNGAGALVVVGDERHGIHPRELHGLWRLRHEGNLAEVHPPSAMVPKSLLPKWRRRPAQETPRSEVRMIRRDALDRMRLAVEGAGALSGLRIDDQRPFSPPTPRPNYLDRLKRFALEE